MSNAQAPEDKKIIVVKVGTEVITNGDAHVNRPFLESLTRQMAALAEGNFFLLVSSGAVGLGKEIIKERHGVVFDGPLSEAQKAVAACVGQPVLMKEYDEVFEEYGFLRGQFMSRNKDYSAGQEEPQKNLRRTLECAASFGKIIPIFNENDTLSYVENRPLSSDKESFSDNDGLASLLARFVQADALVIVSTHAVHLCNPREQETACVPYINFGVAEEDPDNLGITTSGTSLGGRGGMENKLNMVRDYLQGTRQCGQGKAFILARDEVVNHGGLVSVLSGQPAGTQLVCHNDNVYRKADGRCTSRRPCRYDAGLIFPRLKLG